MSNKGIEQLRDKLLARGLVPSQPPPPGADAPRAPQAGPEALAITERVRPFAEAIYLVLAADAQLGERERDVLRGALRALTDGVLSSVSMDNMLSDFEHARTRDGVESRLDNVASSLYGDRNDARLAIRLATAAAEAESGVSDEERAVLAALGDRLGVSEKELSELLQGSSE
jgi:tellurite resistance protein